MAEMLTDEVWGIPRRWDVLARDTVGKQLLRAANSIGANIAEGSGRARFFWNLIWVKDHPPVPWHNSGASSVLRQQARRVACY